MSETTASGSYTGRTAWARNLQSPLRSFLNTETGSSTVVLAAVAAALLWANVDVASYERVWNTELSLRLDGWGLGLTLREWINSGLMTFFFLVIGLEARREFDLGELRERRRLTLPFASALGGMIVPVALYLAFNAGKATAHGWGAAMSTDTALALGMLALVGSRFPERLRAFILTAAVVDDLGALVVIAVVYSEDLALTPILVAIGIFAGIVALRVANIRIGRLYLLLGIALWIALHESGVDPVITGVAVGLIMLAYPASRPDLEHATDVFRLFREQPTPELARSAQWSIETSLSPNDRLQAMWHPWTSYVIVPLFALANAGIAISGHSLARAFGSPVTLGIFFAYIVGKPIGFVGGPWLVTRLSGGRIRPPVGWASLVGGGTIAGIGFTVSLLISTLAFSGDELDDAKIGLLSAGIAASLLTWLVFRATSMLPRGTRLRALLGGAEPLVDLAEAVDTDRDHVRGPLEAHVTVVEYGDFECPYCGQAEPVVRELLRDFGDVRYVWRHLPLNDVHPNAQLAALAAEAAGEQDKFWDMHDLLLEHQDALHLPDLIGYAGRLGLDVERFEADLRGHSGAAHIAEDVDTADLSSVSGTPTFFVNGRRHYGAYDIASLSSAVKAARARAAVAAG